MQTLDHHKMGLFLSDVLFVGKPNVINHPIQRNWMAYQRSYQSEGTHTSLGDGEHGIGFTTRITIAEI